MTLDQVDQREVLLSPRLSSTILSFELRFRRCRRELRASSGVCASSTIKVGPGLVNRLRTPSPESLLLATAGPVQDRSSVEARCYPGHLHRCCRSVVLLRTQLPIGVGTPGAVAQAARQGTLVTTVLREGCHRQCMRPERLEFRAGPRKWAVSHRHFACSRKKGFLGSAVGGTRHLGHVYRFFLQQAD